MESVRQWHGENIAAVAVKALQANGFKALYAPSSAQVADAFAPFLKPGASIGFGGSMTVAALGIRELALTAGCTLLDHNAPGLSPERKLEVLRAQLTCDLFVSSANAVTLDGQIVNVDGTGNRVAALTFGPRATVVVAGVNKLVRDVDEALNRIELYAAPMNNRRLDRPNPCVKTGYCMDCDLETRICRVYQILRKRPTMSDFTVILVGQDLGF